VEILGTIQIDWRDDVPESIEEFLGKGRWGIEASSTVELARLVRAGSSGEAS
jgi:hypothetical protein